MTRVSVRGFSLVELAVVMAIVAFLLGGLMYTLSAQVEQRNFEETRRRLEQARELLLGYAIVNGRLPCPARDTNPSTVASTSVEMRDAATGNCTGSGIDDYYGGTLAGGLTGGFLPSLTIGYQQVDSFGFAVDAWQNRIRYAVAKLNTNCSVSPPANTRLFTHAANLKFYGVSCQPDDLLVCKSAGVTPAVSATSCGGTPAGANQLMSQSLVVAIIFATGKNGAQTPCATCSDALANLDGNATFVFHTPTPATFANGEFDDQFTWITVGELYGKLIAAGVLP
jgi:prepilin-type N-terminal cleavage/methylation domain-containing protein